MTICHCKTFRVMIMMVIMGFLMSSAVFALEIKPLKVDKIAAKYQTIVFGRVRVISSIPKFNPLGEEIKLYLYDLHSKRSLGDCSFVIKSSTRIKGEVKGYDIPFFGQAQSGDYLLDRLGFRFSTAFAGELGVFVNWDGFYNQMDGRIFKACSIPAGSLVYLGVIEVDFTKVAQTDCSNLETVAKVKISFDDFNSDLDKFQKTYPKLYEQFKDKVVQAKWDDLKNTENTADEAEK